MRRLPDAVECPETVEDLVRFVRSCAESAIPFVARGRGHTTFGQAQIVGGVVIDTSRLDGIEPVVDGQVIVEAGARWRDVLRRTLPSGLAPPVLTGFQGTSVAGTLSVGGFGSLSCMRGAQVEHVEWLEVVTAAGETVVCSRTRKADLFDAALGGLGRAGIISRACLRLVPAPRTVLRRCYPCVDSAALIDALFRLATTGGFEGICGSIRRTPEGGWAYEVELVWFEGNDGHTNPAIEARLGPPRVSETYDYLAFLEEVDDLVEQLEEAGLWSAVAHPWFDVFLPGTEAAGFVTDIVGELGDGSLGDLGQIRVFPLRRRGLHRPLPALPDAPIVFLFDVLASATGAFATRPALERTVARNRRWYDRARSLGGTRYGIAALPFSEKDWALEQGDAYARWARTVQAHDPRGLLNPDLFRARAAPHWLDVASEQAVALGRVVQPSMPRVRTEGLVRDLMASWADVPIPSVPAYPSDIGDDASPYEFSLAVSAVGSELRLLVEALGSTPSLATNLVAAEALDAHLVSRYDLDLQRYASVRDVFLPAAEGSVFGVWHAASLTEGSAPDLKIYLNPRGARTRDGRAAVGEAMSRLGLGEAWSSLLVREVLRPDAQDEVMYFSLDLRARSASRVKVYFRHHRVDVAHLERVFALAPSHREGDVSTLVHTVCGHGGPFPGKPVGSCFSFVHPSRSPTAVTLHFPISHYVDSDAIAVERTTRVLDSHALDTDAYLRAIEVLAFAPLAGGKGVQSYLSFRRDSDGPRVTAYLCPQAFARRQMEARS